LGVADPFIQLELSANQVMVMQFQSSGPRYLFGAVLGDLDFDIEQAAVVHQRFPGSGSADNVQWLNSAGSSVIASIGKTGTFKTGGTGLNFQVDVNGDITKLHGVTTSFPSANASGVLHNNGSGTYSIVADGGNGGGLPTGTNTHTLRFNGTSWIDTGVLT